MAEYSSRQVAKKLGLPDTTLSTYLSRGKLPKPKSVTSGDITIYLWTDEDIEHARQLLPKIKNGRKTRYKKQSSESKSKNKKPQPRSAVPHKRSKTKKS